MSVCPLLRSAFTDFYWRAGFSDCLGPARVQLLGDLEHRHYGQFGRIKSKGHGFYLLDLESGLECRKRGHELELVDEPPPPQPKKKKKGRPRKVPEQPVVPSRPPAAGLISWPSLAVAYQIHSQSPTTSKQTLRCRCGGASWFGS